MGDTVVDGEADVVYVACRTTTRDATRNWIENHFELLQYGRASLRNLIFVFIVSFYGIMRGAGISIRCECGIVDAMYVDLPFSVIRPTPEYLLRMSVARIHRNGISLDEFWWASHLNHVVYDFLLANSVKLWSS